MEKIKSTRPTMMDAMAATRAAKNSNKPPAGAGEREGAGDGRNDGCADGDFVGVRDGFGEGAGDGFGEGAGDGFGDGKAEGAALGRPATQKRCQAVIQVVVPAAYWLYAQKQEKSTGSTTVAV